MQRREFVSSLVATGACASLAGCSSVPMVGDGSTPTRDPAHEVTDDLYTAVGQLNTAALALRTVDPDFEDPAAVEFDPEGPRARIDEAREALDAAEAADDGGRAEEIAQVREYATVVESTVEAFVALLDGSRELSGVDGAFADGEYETARAAIDGGREFVADAVSDAEAGLSAGEAIDADRLDELDAEVETVLEGLEEIAAFADGFDALTRGYGDVLDGRGRLEDAQDRFADDAFEDAGTAFGEAREAFESAEETFGEGAETAPEELDGRFGRAEARSASLARLARGYESVVEGRSDLEEGSEAFENEEYERASEAFEDAGTTFEEASSAFEGEPAPDGEFDGEFERARCRADHLTGAAENFRQAADAAADRDPFEAQRRREEGERDLERAENC